MPVRAWPITSVPVSASGTACVWIGNGCVTPTASRASAIAGETPRSRNVVRTVSPLSPTRPGWAGQRRIRRLTGGAARTAVNGLAVALLQHSTGCASRARYAAVMTDAAPPAPTGSPDDSAVGPAAEAANRPAEDALADPAYRAAAVDLLGVLAYAELTAFERISADAALAPTLHDKAALAEVAVAEFHHFKLLRQRLEEMGVDPEEAMAPFVKPLASFHEHTKPADWLEGLVKAYVGDAIAADFYREAAAYVDEQTRQLVQEVLADTGHASFALERVRAAIEADPRVAGRLALWGRRLVGEALSQAQRVAAERDAVSALIVGGVDRPGADLAEIGRMFARLTENHSRRMAALGLSA